MFTQLFRLRMYKFSLSERDKGYKTRQSLTLSSSLFTVTEPSLSQPDLTLKLYEDKRLYFERKGGIQRYRIISDRITSFSYFMVII